MSAEIASASVLRTLDFGCEAVCPSPSLTSRLQPFVFPLAFSRPSEFVVSVGSASAAKAALFKLGVSSVSDIRAAALADYRTLMVVIVNVSSGSEAVLAQRRLPAITGHRRLRMHSRRGRAVYRAAGVAV